MSVEFPFTKSVSISLSMLPTPKLWYNREKGNGKIVRARGHDRIYRNSVFQA